LTHNKCSWCLSCNLSPSMRKFLIPNNTTQALVGFWPTYGVVKAGKPFSDYELICEIHQVP
jgi:hypothetical protein